MSESVNAILSVMGICLGVQALVVAFLKDYAEVNGVKKNKIEMLQKGL